MALGRGGILILGFIQSPPMNLEECFAGHNELGTMSYRA
jgi:hypothetical protein